MNDGYTRQVGSAWLQSFSVRTAPALRLFAFAHAGGAASAYRSWAALLPAFIDLKAVQLPGRENRFLEEPHTNWRMIVAEAAAAIVSSGPLPAVLVGHSLGAILAFEIARVLRDQYGREPAALIVSGRGAPQLEPRAPSLSHLDGFALVEKLAEMYGGIPEEALNDNEMVNFMARVIKADLTVLDGYQFVPGRPLSCPLVAFGGKADEWVSRTELEAWKQQAEKQFSSDQFPGDHFYLRHPLIQLQVLRRVQEVCTSLLGVSRVRV